MLNNGIDESIFDKNTRPQDDFFQYVNRNWLESNPIPPEEARWGTFYVSRDKSWEALREILEELNGLDLEQGTEEQKLRDFYLTGMDEPKLNSEGIVPIKKDLDEIFSLGEKSEIAGFLAKIHLKGVSPFWAFDVDPDLKNSDLSALYLGQSGLGMPDRDYYLSEDAKFTEIRKKYLEYLSGLFSLAGIKKNSNDALKVLEIETRLARASMTRIELRDLKKQYNKMSQDEFSKIAPGLDWRGYFNLLGIEASEPVIVCQPEFFKEVNSILNSYELEDIKMYLAMRLIDESARHLSDDFSIENFNFHKKIITGTAQDRPRWKRVAVLADSFLGEALGKLYVEKYFNQGAKKKIDELVDHITHAFENRIKVLEWMTAETKERALLKLGAITRKLGYPEKWRDYSALEIMNDSFAENIFRASEFESRRRLSKVGKPVDRTEWGMTPQTVNAYCNFTFNEIVFPAGILQPPFFDPDAFEAINYGAIGSIIGHELSHAFDDKGSKFDEFGNMNEWWLEEDRKKFEDRARILVSQFDELMAVDEAHVKGELTLGENIADLAGLTIAYDAFKEAVSGKNISGSHGKYNPEELFFFGFAVAECGHERPEEARRLATIDPHSPARYRVNIPLSNFEPFYKTFGLKIGDKMFRESEARAKIW